MSSSPHRLLAFVAASLTGFAIGVIGLRDSFLVPLLTGNLGYAVVADHFWTPLLNWLAVLALAASVTCAGLAALTWRQARAGADALSPRAVVGLLGGLALLGALVGVLAALASSTR